MIRQRSMTLALFCAVAFSSTLAQAHYLWLEPGEGDVKLFYGEVEEGVREKTPGKLDTIRHPQVTVLTGNEALNAAAVKLPDHFAVSTNGRQPTVLVKVEATEVRDLSKYGLEIAKTNYYARVGQIAAPVTADGAWLAVDIAPQGENAFSILYQGKPVPRAKVQVIAPNTWVQEHTSDQRGQVKINTPWQGRYVIHVLHVDKTPGEHEGMQYQSLRNHFTYSLFVENGLPAGPAIPPQLPAE
ncbi:DUF4198 domain-containing protein [Noviherbaspirillum sp. Root189]|uniref:DUF4198 domain-containing protein n=1 Tax=Noviherbaspirillum sp. Root189 TaxID=1736487 RepID=UPI00070A047E|nr:DUF4198 domain-containing protein [Noviherbaspirillum sp. Root189]KRB79525.1 hypothetical protein ASE07_25310 [Noviherbaspirillum sp. Root189]